MECAGVVLCLTIGRDPGAQPAVVVSAIANELQQSIASGHLTLLRNADFHDLRSSISAVYQQNEFAPLWIADATVSPRGEAILEELSASAAKGLDPEEFDASALREWTIRLQSSSQSSRELAELDLALTINLMRYAIALHQGRVDGRQVHFAIRPKDRLDPVEFVRNYRSSSQSLTDLVQAIEPHFNGYRNTLAALAQYQKIALREPPKMPRRPRLPLKKGQSYSDIPALVARLVLLGDLSPNVEAPSGIYQGALVDAVKRLQLRHGLPASGTLDVPTWRALTVPISRRIEQLELTLERWRWLPSTVTPAIVVNIPEFELRAYDENRQLALRMHVIVGKAYRHKTPVFEDKIEAVVIRPSWDVPLSIQRSEMVPAIRAQPEYLAKNNLQVVDQVGNPASVVSPQALLERLASGDLRLRQQPGPANSLGTLKFDFPNEYSVYMHGTPARQLFSAARRDFSHGCIRVEDPELLAEWVLRKNQSWDRNRILASCNGDRTFRIDVSPPLTVLVLYGTVVAEDDGSVHFFDDLYGYDAELKRALASAAAHRNAVSARVDPSPKRGFRQFGMGFATIGEQ